jgi:hypothetical protein
LNLKWLFTGGLVPVSHFCPIRFLLIELEGFAAVSGEWQSASQCHVHFPPG